MAQQFPLLPLRTNFFAFPLCCVMGGSTETAHFSPDVTDGDEGRLLHCYLFDSVGIISVCLVTPAIFGVVSVASA